MDSSSAIQICHPYLVAAVGIIITDVRCFLLLALAGSLPVWPQTFRTGDPVLIAPGGRMPA